MGLNVQFVQRKIPRKKLMGGVFGTGKHASAWATFFKALGLVLLVYIIRAFMFNG